MEFVKHSSLQGQHALLSASNYHWLNYSDDKLVEYFYSTKAAERGTRLHEFAAEAIRLGIKLANNKNTINMFVNDAIGFKMEPELVLYYSPRCFGTADAICFRKNTLRIHDLKTGVSGNMTQLYIYAALFCLEYDYHPADIKIETRLYKEGEIIIENPEADIIVPVMDKIKTADKILAKLFDEEK